VRNKYFFLIGDLFFCLAKKYRARKKNFIVKKFERQQKKK
jgi:hypothetical protein